MYVKAQRTFYILSGFLLMTALFVLQPSTVSEVAKLQVLIKHQFSVAWQQTIGDQPYFNNVAMVFDGIMAFYDQSTNATIVLFTQPTADQDIYYVFSTTYNIFANVLRHDQPKIAGEKTVNTAIISTNFMTESAIDNIVPDPSTSSGNNLLPERSVSAVEGSVSGSVFQAWNNIQDASTGQIYCLAIYNEEVNKYLGPCKFDYH